jgi:hypothetical protein
MLENLHHFGKKTTDKKDRVLHLKDMMIRIQPQKTGMNQGAP